MNLLLLGSDDHVGDDRWRITGPRFEHLVRVIGAAPGRELRVGWWDGPLGQAEVVSVEPESLTLRAWETGPAPVPTLSLVLAVPRPKMLRKLLPGVAAFGLRRLVLLRSWRTVPAFMDSPWSGPDRVGQMLEDGMAQGRWTARPTFERHDRFEGFFDVPAPESERWVTHPGADTDVAELPDAGAPLCLAVGPEGGWIPYEVERFRQAGFRPVRSGSAILRTEVACVALLAQAALLQRRRKEPETPP